MYVIILELI